MHRVAGRVWAHEWNHTRDTKQHGLVLHDIACHAPFHPNKPRFPPSPNLPFVRLCLLSSIEVADGTVTFHDFSKNQTGNEATGLCIEFVSSPESFTQTVGANFRILC
jgi:hypothetical protein